jgi:hypothetical protein
MIVGEAQSERLAMTLAIRNMRSGLQLATAEKLIRGEENRLPELLAKNPLEFIGQRDGRGSGAWGDWQFDRERHELVYRPMVSWAFESRGEIRWRIAAIPGPGGRLSGLRLVEVSPAPATH